MNPDRSDTPATVYSCRRNGRRHRLVSAKDAFIEFVSADGRSCRLELLDITSEGVCFELHHGLPVLESGCRIDRVVVRIANTKVNGVLTIAHATETFAAGTICGARFHPTTDADARNLEQAIAALGP